MQVIKVQTNAKVSWRYMRDPNDDFIAVCDPLGLTVSGGTFEELLACVQDSLNLLMLDLLARNELPRFLRERGWTLITPAPTRQTRARDLRFDIPFSVTPERERGAEAALRT